MGGASAELEVELCQQISFLQGTSADVARCGVPGAVCRECPSLVGCVLQRVLDHVAEERHGDDCRLSTSR